MTETCGTKLEHQRPGSGSAVRCDVDKRRISPSVNNIAAKRHRADAVDVPRCTYGDAGGLDALPEQ